MLSAMGGFVGRPTAASAASWLWRDERRSEVKRGEAKQYGTRRNGRNDGRQDPSSVRGGLSGVL